MAESAREKWRVRVQRWRDSGLKAREYCAETGLNVHTLWMWSARLPREGTGRAPGAKRSTKPKFIEVTKALPLPGSPALELVVCETVVRVPVGFDEETLRRVLALVRQP